MQTNEAVVPAIQLRDLVAMLRTMLLAREGETITPRVAEERARNIACALVGTRIAGGRDHA